MPLNSFYRMGCMQTLPFRFLSKNIFFGMMVSLSVIFIGSPASAQSKNVSPTTPVATVCSASDFKALAYTTNDAQLREERAKEWLSKYGKLCPLDQIEIILMNQALWLGTSNTPPIISATETLFKQKKASAEDQDKPVDKPKGSAANKK
jgi:hypothetical protein